MLRKLSKIFLVLATVSLVCCVGLLLTHTYFNNHFFHVASELQHPASQFFKNDRDTVSVLVASDSGSNNYVLEHVISHARRTHGDYDFMMHLGDMATTSITGYYWMLSEIRPRLHGMPLYTIPGNHDVTKRVAGKYETNKAYYTTVMGPAYYWFGYNNTLFIALDTSMSDLDAVQAHWLDETLRNIRPLFRNCVIFSHVPPINVRPDWAPDHTMHADDAARFADIIRKYKIDAIFCGHVHFYSKTPFAGTTLYTIPASGQEPRDRDNPSYGYVSLVAHKNAPLDVDVEYVHFDGDKREFIEEWWARDILSTRSQDLVSVLLSLTAMFGAIALALHVAHRLRNRTR